MTSKDEGKLVLKSSFMDKTAVLETLKTKFGHTKFRSEEQRKAIFTLIGGNIGNNYLSRCIIHYIMFIICR